VFCGLSEEERVSSEHDALPIKLLGHPTATEARAWLALEDGVSRTLGQSDSVSLCRAFVEELYAAGAIRVTATEMDRYELDELDGVTYHENTGRLVVELPVDPARRKKLFRVEAKVARGVGFDPTDDVGQRYLFLMLD
jgi:hypothetical protein